MQAKSQISGLIDDHSTPVGSSWHLGIPAKLLLTTAHDNDWPRSELEEPRWHWQHPRPPSRCDRSNDDDDATAPGGDEAGQAGPGDDGRRNTGGE